MTWTFDTFTIGLLLAGTTLYGLGVRAARRYEGTGQAGRGPLASHHASFQPWRIAMYGLGILSLVAALVSPLAALSQVRFAAHMTQHEMLMLVAAPLLVIGQPLLAWFWALPRRWRIAAAQRFRSSRALPAWQWLTAPLVVFLLHGAVLWVWHIPVLFEWALGDYWVHGVQHLMFVATAALFWWGMVQGRYGRAGYGVGVLYVFLTALHSTLLGALLTVAPKPWYDSYALAAHGPHTDALGDQQLAGLIMWVPTGVIFIVVGLALFAAWLGEAERRARAGSVTAARRA